MGWKPGQAASRKRTGPVEPYLPTARPALLGIGAKEREVLDDGSKNGKRKHGQSKQDKMKYLPLVKTGGGGGASVSAPGSRRASRSPSPDRRRDRDEHRSRQRGAVADTDCGPHRLLGCRRVHRMIFITVSTWSYQ